MKIIIIVIATVIGAQADRRCFTPDAKLGTCRSINRCPALLNLWKHGNQQNKSFVEISRCEGPFRKNVCCGPRVSYTTDFTLSSEDCQKFVAPPDPSTQCCGVEASIVNKIYGGNETSIDQYPWMVLIEYKKWTRGPIILRCAGSLISSKYVLTAAHCIDNKTYIPINIRLGEYDISSDGPDCIEVDGGGVDCTEGTTVIPIEKIIVHQKDDIALIRMTKHAPYTDFIRPICLPTFSIEKEARRKKDLTLYVAGWGAVNKTKRFSKIKRHVAVPYAKCHSRSDKKPSRYICAGGVFGKDSCNGDSGGPLMYERNRIYSVVGIVSRGPELCGSENIPAHYANVYQFLSWIRTQMKP